jgi:hypothetical protein
LRIPTHRYERFCQSIAHQYDTDLAQGVLVEPFYYICSEIGEDKFESATSQRALISHHSLMARERVETHLDGLKSLSCTDSLRSKMINICRMMDRLKGASDIKALPISLTVNLAASTNPPRGQN